jgi:hypothetical protein
LLAGIGRWGIRDYEQLVGLWLNLEVTETRRFGPLLLAAQWIMKGPDRNWFSAFAESEAQAQYLYERSQVTKASG